MDQPQFTHDCGNCIFLGQYNARGILRDLYFCKQGGTVDTVIERWGDEGPQYNSGLSAAGMSDALNEARRRAVSKGLLAEPESGPTICAKCKHYWPALHWANQLCKASPIEPKLNIGTGLMERDQEYQNCRDVNNGACPLFEARK